MLTLRFPGANWYPNVTIHLMSYNIDLVLENIALEIITGGVFTANVTISSGKFWPKCLCTRLFDVI